jgi:hypothetical protein
VGNWQGSAGIIINAILSVFSTLSKNHESNEERELIIGFPLKNRIIYSLPRIYHDDEDAYWWIGRLLMGNLVGICRYHQRNFDAF